MPSDLPELEYHLVNAFTTDTRHSGNQAAVVIFPTASDPRTGDDDFLLATAQDFGFSETAYLVPIDADNGRFGLRWFTEEVEVPICGHATLASAAVIFKRYPHLSHAIFETRFWGELQAANGSDGEVTISLSTLSPSALEHLTATTVQNTSESGPVIANGLGISVRDILAIGEFEYIHKSLIVELRPEVDLGAVKADLTALAQPSPAMTIVTQMRPELSSAGRLHICTRVFWLGTMEDPVTGSAHAFLTGYYLLTPTSNRIPQPIIGNHLRELILDASQLSPRGGKLRCELKEEGMVELTGTAVEWGRGTLLA